MNNPAMTIKGEQAKKQLIAAALAQFGEYGMNATTREIAAQAGQNIAAITYYFGSENSRFPQEADSFVRYGRMTKPATRLIKLVGMKIAPNTDISRLAILASTAYLDAENT